MSEKRKIVVDGEEFEVNIMVKDNNWEVSINGKKFKVESKAIMKPKKRRKISTRKEHMGSGVVNSAIPGKVVKEGPAITPARPANPVPTPNTPIKTKGTLCPRASTVFG